MTAAFDRLLDRLRQEGKTVRADRPNHAMAQCPAHDDRNPSLSITLDNDRVLLHCHSECDSSEILGRIGWTWDDLKPDRQHDRKTVIAEYAYTDELGKVLFVKERYDPKDFRQYVPLLSGGRRYSLDGVRRLLFHLPAVRIAIEAGEPIYIPEGEKDVEALEDAGVIATTWPGGAWKPGAKPKWRADYSKQLAGAHVVIWRDRDENGCNTANDIAAALKPHAASVKIVESAAGKDAYDHLKTHGLTINDVVPVDDNQQRDDGQQEDDPATPALLLPESFWGADQTLQNIRAYAHSRRTSADAFLYNVLAKISAMVPPECRLETGIGSHVGASLNLFVAAVGPSGRGKSSSKSVAKIVAPPEELDQFDRDQFFRDEQPIGTGEGIAEAFMGTVMIDDTARANTRTGHIPQTKERQQVRHNAFFYVDEGEQFSKLHSRDAAILGPTIRSAWYGDLIGTANADSAKYRVIPEGSYSIGMVIGFQPETIQPLLKDAHNGTPQRFLYCWTVDSTRPRRPPKTNTPLIKVDAKPQMMTLDPEVAGEIGDHHDDQTTGAIDVALLDAHDYLTRAKLAALLALLCHPGTMHVTKDDWQLAGIMWETSCAVRDHLVGYGEQIDRQKRRAANQYHAEREGMAEIARSGSKSKIERVARLIAKHVHDSGDRTVSAVRDERLASRDRDVFDPALDHAEAQGWVIVDDTDLEPGDSRPSEARR